MGIIWWMYGIGMHGEAPHWVVEEVVLPAGGTRRGRPGRSADLEKAARARHRADAAADPRSSRSSTSDADPPSSQDEVEPTTSASWQILAGVRTRPSARRRPPSTSTSRATPLEALGLEGAADYVTVVLVRDAAARTTCPTTRAGSTASRTSSRPPSCSSSTRPHYAVVQVQPVDRAGDRAGRGAAHPRARRRTQPVVSVIMVRDLGDVRLPGRHAHDRLRAPVRVIARACSHRRDQLVAAGARPALAGRRR